MLQRNWVFEKIVDKLKVCEIMRIMNKDEEFAEYKSSWRERTNSRFTCNVEYNVLSRDEVFIDLCNNGFQSQAVTVTPEGAKQLMEALKVFLDNDA